MVKVLGKSGGLSEKVIDNWLDLERLWELKDILRGREDRLNRIAYKFVNSHISFILKIRYFELGKRHNLKAMIITTLPIFTNLLTGKLEFNEFIETLSGSSAAYQYLKASELILINTVDEYLITLCELFNEIVEVLSLELDGDFNKKIFKIITSDDLELKLISALALSLLEFALLLNTDVLKTSHRSKR